MNRIMIVFALLAMTAGGFAILAQAGAKEADRTLAVRKSDKVTLDATFNETWKAAPSIKTGTFYKKDAPGPEVELRALHDGASIYIMARWKDETKSDTKKAWTFKDGAWTKADGDEDRIALAFNHNVDGFDQRGCMTLCHDGEMSAKTEGQRADLWHWKAARGGQQGKCDDQHFQYGDTGRADDAGKSAYESNASEDGKAPKWIWKDDADTTLGFTADTTREMPADFKPEVGYSVPSILLRDSDGSRGDITSAASWSDGMWTVVLKRKLDTGNKDDTALALGSTVKFAVAVFNDTGAKTGHEHAKSMPISLNLE